MEKNSNRSPLVTSGVIMGAGLGGFVDGILFHQIFQFHNMLTGRLPATDIISMKANMVWDGIFHAAVWIMTCVGLAMLFRAGRRKDVPWSGKILTGSLLSGWGLFNFVEGIIDHHILGLHHVYESASNHLPADLAFLASGVILMLIGWSMIRVRREGLAPRGEGSRARLAS